MFFRRGARRGVSGWHGWRRAGWLAAFGGGAAGCRRSAAAAEGRWEVGVGRWELEVGRSVRRIPRPAASNLQPSSRGSVSAGRHAPKGSFGKREPGGGNGERGEFERRGGPRRPSAGTEARDYGVGNWELGVGSWAGACGYPPAGNLQPSTSNRRRGAPSPRGAMRPRGRSGSGNREAGTGNGVNSNVGVGLAGPPRARRPATRELGGGRWELGVGSWAGACGYPPAGSLQPSTFNLYGE
ncbi:MAG: hypothetical protein KatS3mg064_2075 [Tepidiforma sp.]|nr:MAG: hypothetical protein KatS3mg064_2075 [Tepidiforma sp.]